MKIHKPLFWAVLETLQKIVVEGVYADKAVEYVLKSNSKWGARDRRFIAETTYGIVRWWRLIDEANTINDKRSKMYFYHSFAIYLLLNNTELPDWEELSQLNKESTILKLNELKSIRKFRESYPDWLDSLMLDELGEAVWEQEACALNQEASVVLRVNTLKTSKEKLKQLLAQQAIQTEYINTSVDALKLVKRQNLQSLKEYQNGFFEIQDASSQLIAPFLDLNSGMTVIDACAGAGGKSLHIAALMKNAGNIISMDVEERKLIELERRAKRGGVKIIKTRLINEQTIHQLKNVADRLLLDVPCSGLGILKRNPDAKWKLNLDFITEIIKTQQHILSTYSSMLKLDGILVYATCSILPSENQHQVELFLKNHSDFTFMEDCKILAKDGFDGFYMAKLKKVK